MHSRRLADKQKEDAWWQETKNNPKVLRSMIADFCKMFPNAPGRGGARAKGFKVAEYKEYLKSQTEVQKRFVGKMMWEEDLLCGADVGVGGLAGW